MNSSAAEYVMSAFALCRGTEVLGSR